MYLVTNIEPFRSTLTAVVLMAGYPVLSTLIHHDYPLWSMEVLILLASIILAAILIALPLLKCRPLLVNASLMLGVTLSLQVQFNMLLEGAAITLAAGAVIAWISRQRFCTMATAVFCGLMVGAIIDDMIDESQNRRQDMAEAGEATLPPVLHIVLDGLIGIEGLPPQEPAQVVKRELLDVLERGGFDVYSQAYSHYFSTEDSLLRALNFRSDDQAVFAANKILKRSVRIGQNAYLSGLQDQGYRLRIYQADVMDLCGALGAIERCWTYSYPNLTSLRHGVASPWTRAGVILKVLVSRSTILKALIQWLGMSSSWGVSGYQPAVLDELVLDFQQSPRGRVHFAHLMLPHAPYVHDRDCQFDYEVPIGLRFGTDSSQIPNDHNSRGMRYIQYLEQVRCSLTLLDGLFLKMREFGIYDDAMIIIHGDHGSRIYQRTPSESNQLRLDQDDLKDAYSTLFAVKRPAGEFRIHSRTVALEHLIAQVSAWLNGEPSDLPQVDPFVYLSGSLRLKRLDIDIFDHTPWLPPEQQPDEH